MEEFLLTREEKIAMQGPFSRCLESVDISCISKETILELDDFSGCYFWTMLADKKEYKIYIGRTRSIRNRVKDYSKGFQLHSPNDYKIQFFQEFINDNFCNVCLDLYFMKLPIKETSEREAKLIRTYKPLINDRMQTSIEDKNAVKDAHRQYYFNYWKKLSGDA